jgi:hypothetical protein
MSFRCDVCGLCLGSGRGPLRSGYRGQGPCRSCLGSGKVWRDRHDNRHAPAHRAVELGFTTDVDPQRIGYKQPAGIGLGPGHGDVNRGD